MLLSNMADVLRNKVYINEYQPYQSIFLTLYICISNILITVVSQNVQIRLFRNVSNDNPTWSLFFSTSACVSVWDMIFVKLRTYESEPCVWYSWGYCCLPNAKQSIQSHRLLWVCSNAMKYLSTTNKNL